MSVASSPNFSPVGGGSVDNETQKALLEGRAAISAAQTFAIEYIADREGMATDKSGPLRRIARAQCPECGSRTDVHQALDRGSNTYLPEASKILTDTVGWHSDGERMFCGKWCMQRYGHKMLQHGGKPIPPVQSINDKSYAKTMYATPPATTPAGPIVTGRAPHKR